MQNHTASEYKCVKRAISLDFGKSSMYKHSWISTNTDLKYLNHYYVASLCLRMHIRFVLEAE